jgi:hypothetical protein
MDERRDAGEQSEVLPDSWTTASLPIGRGGWLAYADASVPEWVYVRVRENERGRFVITELQLARERVDSATLRALPLGRIEARANSFPIAEEIRAKLNEPLQPGVEPQSPELRPRWEPRKIISPTPHLTHLAVPKGTKPDRFYKEAAELYTELAKQSRRPAADLAERSGVSVASVHRWIAEARRRGYLPPASIGRRG